jgi:Replication-relaxation
MQATTAKAQRHENILLSLKKLGFLSRSQIQRLHRLKSDRNANRVLKDLAPYLHSVRLGENVYYLNAAGRERVGATKALKKTNQIEHHLMRNALYITYGCPATWANEVKFEVPGEVTIVADAAFQMGGAYTIVEIDHTQRMQVNRDKIKRYKRLVELAVFEKPPRFIWVTTTEYRRKQLTALCEGLKATVYLAKDFA